MNTAKALKVILIITCIQLLIFIAWPIYIFSTENLGLGVFGIGFIFASLMIYYLVYLVSLTRYIETKPIEPKVGSRIFFNILPIIIYALIFLFD
ncbi:hypothetical protein SAMN05216464_102201 [Mucilaginibacter pineti]|uniref:Uncharacterized protein n=1 Tax=Mucilaginibacter pineti TaxID=1391627 RepID=A0A1G6WIX4_9SPHI|nr:hypothetical protein SAMN05216464_102201 [Mucilaginibacter pineti]